MEERLSEAFSLGQFSLRKLDLTLSFTHKAAVRRETWGAPEPLGALGRCARLGLTFLLGAGAGP